MADLPESLDLNLDRSNLQANQRCGNCKHFKRIANPAYEKLCKELGITEISRPCAKFSSDPTKIRFKGERNARYAADFIKDLSDDKLLLFASTLIEERRTRRYGFHFGQTVYILAFGSDYLSNYRRLKVVSADRKYVHLQADDGFTAMLLHKSVLTPKQWEKKRHQLIAKEQIEDPKYARYTRSISHAEMQLQHVRDNLKAQEFDSTNKHEFGATRGSIKITRLKNKGYSDVTRITPLDKIFAVRTR